MSVKLSDLPASVRAQLEADGKVPAKKRLSRAGVGEAAPCEGTCGTCGETFPKYTAWVRHKDAEHNGGGRWAITLGVSA